MSKIDIHHLERIKEDNVCLSVCLSIIPSLLECKCLNTPDTPKARCFISVTI